MRRKQKNPNGINSTTNQKTTKHFNQTKIRHFSFFLPLHCSHEIPHGSFLWHTGFLFISVFDFLFSPKRAHCHVRPCHGSLIYLHFVGCFCFHQKYNLCRITIWNRFPLLFLAQFQSTSSPFSHSSAKLFMCIEFDGQFKPKIG